MKDKIKNYIKENELLIYGEINSNPYWNKVNKKEYNKAIGELLDEGVIEWKECDGFALKLKNK